MMPRSSCVPFEKQATWSALGRKGMIGTTRGNKNDTRHGSGSVARKVSLPTQSCLVLSGCKLASAQRTRLGKSYCDKTTRAFAAIFLICLNGGIFHSKSCTWFCAFLRTYRKYVLWQPYPAPPLMSYTMLSSFSSRCWSTKSLAKTVQAHD